MLTECQRFCQTTPESRYVLSSVTLLISLTRQDLYVKSVDIALTLC